MPACVPRTHPPLARRFLPLAAAILLSTTPSLPAAPPLFPPDNPWNQKITTAPVAANSAAIISNITTRYGDGRFHPDFGQDYQDNSDLYGIPYAVVHGNTTLPVSIAIDAYPTQSDVTPVPLPATVVLEGDFQNGPKAGLANRGDSHLLVWDQDNNTIFEFYSCSRPSENPADGLWHADAEAVWHANTNNFRPLGWTSADAAGLPILPGLARPDEALPVAQGGAGVITHALRFTLQNNVILNQYLYPASHVANPGNNNAAIQPPMGSRFRLKAGVDISALQPQSKIIAQAMKDYGLILADNGSNFFVTGASYSPNLNNASILTWNDDDIQDSIHGLKSLHFSDFEVVSLTPIVAGLSPATAAAGSTITILGQNFSGAAGHLSVFFDSTPSTSVSFVDDTHLTALVPSGSGTVDVRVQSGVTVTADPENYNSTIFGYGRSAITTTTADQFTYGAPALVVCCRGATCTLVAPTVCTTGSARAGAVIAPGAACNTTGIGTAPCCYADYNKTGGITVGDIFDFLSDWFAANPYAGAGPTGTPTTPTVQSIFSFLSYWFARGC